MSLDLAALLARQQPGMTLDNVFYTSPELFRVEGERLLLRKWHYVGHESQLDTPGTYLLHDMCAESVIIVRGQDQNIRAFYNVCRHRGSRICLEPEGHRRSFVCPYHAWTYDLTGKLVNSRGMPSSFDPEQHSLTECPVRVLEGLVFVNHSADGLPDFSIIADQLGPFMKFHGLKDAKVAAAREYMFEGNWKLVLDNFHECLHCGPAHKTFSQVHDHAAGDDIPGVAPGGAVKDWEKHAREMGHLTGHLDVRYEVPEQPFRAHRRPLRAGYDTHTTDGMPVAPLMGEATQYDGGHTGIVIEPFFSVQAANDHATLFSMRPIDERRTAMTLQWLVQGGAEEGRDYDVERMTEIWHVTSLEDERIVNNNQLGVESRAYRPGPYHPKEAMSMRAASWYLDQMRASFE